MLEPSISNLELSPPQPPKKHQLDNEGCRCPMCQKLNHEETMKIVVQPVVDQESECYGAGFKEFYLRAIGKMGEWVGRGRGIRFRVPEICVYEGSQPCELILKKSQEHPIKSIRDKSKMHMFQILQFFLQGYLRHNPPLPSSHNPRHPRHPSSSPTKTPPTQTQAYKNECIVLAKYKNNSYNMLTLTQMQSLFKSRHKYMRDGLMYLQTMVCVREYREVRVSMRVRDWLGREEYERARNQVRIFYEEVKSSDMDYVSQQEEIRYENQLKATNMRSFLQYLTLKLILALSKTKSQSTILSESVFKYVHSKTDHYLIDIRVSKTEPSQQFWASAAMKAFEYKLARRMSMMDMKDGKGADEGKRYLGSKALNLSMWLEKNTEVQWDQMKVIRTRLERLEKEKKSLMQSQSMMEGKQDMVNSKSFKIRSMNRY